MNEWLGVGSDGLVWLAGDGCHKDPSVCRSYLKNRNENERVKTMVEPGISSTPFVSDKRRRPKSSVERMQQTS